MKMNGRAQPHTTFPFHFDPSPLLLSMAIPLAPTLGHRECVSQLGSPDVSGVKGCPHITNTHTT